MDQTVIVYEAGGDIRLEVQTDGETVWLTQAQMCRLFGRDQSVVARHIHNVFAEGELVKDETVYAKNAYTARDGKTYNVAFYSLDVVISVGYRVKSVQGTRFRQWATRVLRELLLRRYEDLKNFVALEDRVDALEGDVVQIKQGMDYLVRQVTVPPADSPMRKIGFVTDRRS